MKWATVLVLALVVMAVSNGHAMASHYDLRCVDQDGNGQVDKEEARAVVAAYFSPEHPLAPPPPPPSQLSQTTEAVLWVTVSQHPQLTERLLVHADTAFDIDTFDLEVFVDGTEYCNGSKIYGDEGNYKLGCGSDVKVHTSVSSVSAQTADFPDLLGDMRCERNSYSNDERSVFACEWR